jgi:hypothetical protein
MRPPSPKQSEQIGLEVWLKGRASALQSWIQFKHRVHQKTKQKKVSCLGYFVAAKTKVSFAGIERKCLFWLSYFKFSTFTPPKPHRSWPLHQHWQVSIYLGFSWSEAHLSLPILPSREFCVLTWHLSHGSFLVLLSGSVQNKPISKSKR